MPKKTLPIQELAEIARQINAAEQPAQILEIAAEVVVKHEDVEDARRALIDLITLVKEGGEE